jgi:hypothetical protein
VLILTSALALAFMPTIPTTCVNARGFRVCVLKQHQRRTPRTFCRLDVSSSP